MTYSIVNRADELESRADELQSDLDSRTDKSLNGRPVNGSRRDVERSPLLSQAERYSRDVDAAVHAHMRAHACT